MKKTILSVMKKVMLLALLLTMGNIYSYSSPVQVSMNIRAQKGQALLHPNVISADYIYVGNDVTDRMEHGDVILGQGDITLKAGYIEIKNSTTVSLGTTLIIEN